MVVNAVFGRSWPTGQKGVPSARMTGAGMLTSLLRRRCTPREPA